MLCKINVEIVANKREHRNFIFWFQKFLEWVYNYFITSELESSNKRDSINKEIDFHHLKRFYDDVLRHFRECIKNLRRNIFIISVVNELNCRFICVHRACQIDLKNFCFYSKLKHDFQLLRLRQEFAYAVNVNIII